MKNGLKILVLVLFVAFGCKKESDDKQTTQNAQIVRKWKLVGLVNISDEQKYLNAILELKDNKEYIHTGNDDQIRSQGTWEIENDYLLLTNTLFNNGGEPKYNILKLDLDTLNLQEHYTLGGKDAYLEYHYSSKL